MSALPTFYLDLDWIHFLHCPFPPTRVSIVFALDALADLECGRRRCWSTTNMTCREPAGVAITESNLVRNTIMGSIIFYDAADLAMVIRP